MITTPKTEKSNRTITMPHEAGAGVDDELLDIIEMVAVIMDGMKEDTYGK